MDANRFDTLLRSLNASHPRRTLIPLVAGLVLGGTAATRWSSETEAKRKGRKKRRKKQGQGPSNPPPGPPPGQGQCPATCPECQQCANGRSCTPLNGGVCQNNPCKLCRGGACVDNNGESCGNSLCKECRDGQCVYKAKGTSCNGEGQCINGACVEPPPCDGKGTECSWGLNCCSLDCVNGQCAVSGVGDYCRTSRDCNVNDVAGLNYCDTNFQCREPGIGS